MQILFNYSIIFLIFAESDLDQDAHEALPLWCHKGSHFSTKTAETGMLV